jgi:hypothetical protein
MCERASISRLKIAFIYILCGQHVFAVEQDPSTTFTPSRSKISDALFPNDSVLNLATETITQTMTLSNRPEPKNSTLAAELAGASLGALGLLSVVVSLSLWYRRRQREKIADRDEFEAIELPLVEVKNGRTG